MSAKLIGLVKLIGLIRVSTGKQGESGLGLEASNSRSRLTGSKLMVW